MATKKNISHKNEALGRYVQTLVDTNADGSYRQAAQLMDCTISSIWYLAHGDIVKPQPKTLERVARRLGGNYGKLMLLAGYDKYTTEEVRYEKVKTLDVSPIVDSLLIVAEDLLSKGDDNNAFKLMEIIERLG